MSFRILHLEDDPKDAELIQAMLHAGGIGCEFLRVETREEFLAALEGDRFDLILADFHLPRFDGLSALSICARKCPAVPFVLVSGTMGEEHAIESLKSGATDYVLKQKLSRLVPAVRRSLAEAEERKKLKAAEDMFRAAIEASPNGVLMADATGKIVLVNPKIPELFGYHALELIGQPVEILIPERSREKHAQLHAGYMNNPRVRPVGMGRDLFGVRKDGTEFPVEIGLNPLQLGGEQMILASIIDITERKKAERALQEAEAKYRHIFENALEGIFQSTSEGRYLTANPATARMLGYESPEDLIHSVTDIARQLYVNPSRRREFERRVAKEELVRGFEAEFYRKDGSKIWVSFNAHAVRDGGGELLYYEGLVENITDRKLAEEALRQSEQRFRELAENIREIFFVAGPTGSPIYYVSPAYEQVTGRTCDTLYRNPAAWLEDIHPDDRPRVEQALNNHPETFNEEYRIFSLDSTMHWMHLRAFPVKDASAKVVRLVGIAEDITERKAGEARLHLQAAALDAAANGIVITDSRGKILWVNPAFTTLTGYSATEAVGANPRILKSGVHEPSFYADLWTTILSGKVWQSEIVNRRKDGTLYTEEQTITPVMDSLGEILHFIAIKQDISRRKAAEAASERNLTRIRTLHEIDLAIMSSLDLNSVLYVLLESVNRFLPYPYAGDIRLLNRETGLLEPVASLNVNIEEWKPAMLSSGGDLSREIVETKAPLVIADIHSDPRTQQVSLLRKHGLVSFIGVPLIAKDDCLGILGYYSKEKREFADQEVEFLSTLAGQAAIAINNAQLYQQTRKQTRDLQRAYEDVEKQEQIQRLLKELSQDITHLDLTSLLQKLTHVARQFLKVDICDIRIRETDATRVTAASGIELEKLRSLRRQGRTRLRNYTENRAPIRVSDLSKDRDRMSEGSTALLLGIRGYLGAPFFSRSGHFLGILRALNYAPRDFTQQEADLLQQLANGAAIAIENARLYRDLEKSNKVKNEFLGIMSHELRTPLHVIMGYTQMMLDGILGELKPQQQDRLQKVTKQSKDLLAMIESIMQATKIESDSAVVELHEVNLNDFLSDLRAPYDKPLEKSVSLIWNYSSDLPVIKTDSFKLAHTLQNLINNALKFTDQGSVTVSARVVESKGQSAESRVRRAESITHGAERTELATQSSPLSPQHSSGSALRFIEFTVSDSGIGIARENLPGIFDLFRQVDSSDTRLHDGMGLGLFIVKKFTALLGGTVEVESQPGYGSTFKVAIPVGN